MAGRRNGCDEERRMGWVYAVDVAVDGEVLRPEWRWEEFDVVVQGGSSSLRGWTTRRALWRCGGMQGERSSVAAVAGRVRRQGRRREVRTRRYGRRRKAASDFG